MPRIGIGINQCHIPSSNPSGLLFTFCRLDVGFRVVLRLDLLPRTVKVQEVHRGQIPPFLGLPHAFAGRPFGVSVFQVVLRVGDHAERAIWVVRLMSKTRKMVVFLPLSRTLV